MALTNRNKLTIGAVALASVVTTATFLLTNTEPSPSLPAQAAAVLGPLTPIGNSWYDQTEVSRGKVHGQCPETPPADVDAFMMSQYYDLPMAEYANYQRTGDVAFLEMARKCADVWWLLPNLIAGGTQRDFDNGKGPAPRNAGLGGLILRAMDGRPEMWDWIVAYVVHQDNLWLKSRINDPQLYIGIREGAFVLQYMAWVARLLPDSYPLQAGGTATNGALTRASLLGDIQAITVQYFQRLQFPDGSWRWDDHYYVDPVDGSQLRGIMQPFQIGLLLSALVDVHQLTTNATVKASVQTQITKACRHLYLDGPYTKQHAATLNVNVRGFHYFYHGGTTLNPTRYEKGDLPPDWNPTTHSDIQNQRQPIGLLIEGYAYAYKLTGDEFFKQAGDELWDSAFGPTDGIHNYMAGDAKSYNQNVRRAGTWLGWLAGQAQPTPTVTVTPAVSPTATLATESPSNTRIPTAPKIIDSVNDTWTRLDTGVILRNGQNTSGVGSQVLYCQRTVYAFGTDSQWYKWSGGWGAVGTIDPCGSATPTPSIAPLPSPSPQPSPSPSPRPSPSPSPAPVTCQSTNWPSSAQGQNSKMDERRAQGCYPVRRSGNSMEYARP